MRTKHNLKSISVLIPLQKVSASISQLDFSLDGITTIVAEGKFWRKMLYVNGEETISVSEEIGDDFHRRIHDKDENVHGSGNLMFPRMSIPYYEVEYSVNIWGATYFFTFDALFDPHIVLEKRQGKRLSGLIHVLKYDPTPDRLLTL